MTLQSTSTALLLAPPQNHFPRQILRGFARAQLAITRTASPAHSNSKNLASQRPARSKNPTVFPPKPNSKLSLFSIFSPLPCKPCAGKCEDKHVASLQGRDRAEEAAGVVEELQQIRLSHQPKELKSLRQPHERVPDSQFARRPTTCAHQAGNSPFPRKRHQPPCQSF